MVMANLRFHLFKFSWAFSVKLALLAGFFTLVETPQILLAAGIPQRWEPRAYQPPAGIGAPSRTEGGGTRSSLSCPIAGKPLKALVPSNRFGATVAAYPTFFVYMPTVSSQTSPLPVEFVLEDKNGNEVYTSSFNTSGMPGIVTLGLPTQSGLPPLEVGQDYKWSFSVICQPDDRSRDITVEGWVRRVPLNPTLNTQINQASPEKKVELYAQAELWHDALATLAQLRREKPNDSAVAADWVKLLSAAGLSDITQESLLPGSAIPTRQVSLTQP
jgi:hypothetical protein